jgi:hypothetical protein
VHPTPVKSATTATSAQQVISHTRFHSAPFDFQVPSNSISEAISSKPDDA